MIEIAYQNSFERDHFEGFEDSFYKDQVYSVDFVWNVLGRNAPFQPYFKVGIGELNRDSSVYNPVGQSSVENLAQVTAVLGAGLKLYLTKVFALRVEGTSYLTGPRIASWKDNFGATFGISFYY